MKAVLVTALVALVVGGAAGYGLAWRSFDRYTVVPTRAGALRMDRTNGQVQAIAPNGRLIHPGAAAEKASNAEPYWIAP